jgi:hypothetical protein
MLSTMLFDRPEVFEDVVKVADLAQKYTPNRMLAPALTPTLMPEEQEEVVVRSIGETEKPTVAAPAEETPKIIQVGRYQAYYDPEIDKLVDVKTGRPFDVGSAEETSERGTITIGGREAYLDTKTNEYKDAKTGEVISNYAEGGSVQRLRNGGQARMSGPRRSGNIPRRVTLADLARYYGEGR